MCPWLGRDQQTAETELSCCDQVFGHLLQRITLTKHLGKTVVAKIKKGASGTIKDNSLPRNPRGLLRKHLHDGVDTPAVPLPHAPEPGLPSDVPDLQTRQTLSTETSAARGRASQAHMLLFPRSRSAPEERAQQALNLEGPGATSTLEVHT